MRVVRIGDVWTLAGCRRGQAALGILNDVGEFVEQELVSGPCPGLVLAWSEEDVPSGREGVGVHGLGRLPCGAVGMNPCIGHIGPECLREPRRDLRWQGLSSTLAYQCQSTLDVNRATLTLSVSAQDTVAFHGEFGAAQGRLDRCEGLVR